MPRVQPIGPITHQPADLGKFTSGIDRGNPIARRERCKLYAPADEKALTRDIEGVGRVAPKAGEGGLDLTGSSPTPKTIGIVEVAALAAWAPARKAGVAITSTRRRTRSAMTAGRRSNWPSSQWYSTITFWPST